METPIRLCKDCANCIIPDYPSSLAAWALENARCSIFDMEQNPVDGSVKKQFCSVARDSKSKCGRDAALFLPKSA